MSDFDPHRYTITIKLVTLDEGEHFEAAVAELPDVVEYGETYDQAYSLVVDSISTLRDAAIEQGRTFPDPMPSRSLDEFSGRVTLRMSKSLHAASSKLADADGVSLNSWIVEAISTRAGSESAGAAIKKAQVIALADRNESDLRSWIVTALSALEGSAIAKAYRKESSSALKFWGAVGSLDLSSSFAAPASGASAAGRLQALTEGFEFFDVRPILEQSTGTAVAKSAPMQ